MVLCWIALPIFAFLGIFSAKYRKLTAESLECLFKTATFRKCSSGLDDRIKSQITGKLLKFSPSSARFFYKYYKIIAIILLILFLWSTYVSAVGIYNYVQYGNCNGKDSTAFCVLNVLDGTQKEEPCPPNGTVSPFVATTVNEIGLVLFERYFYGIKYLVASIRLAPNPPAQILQFASANWLSQQVVLINTINFDGGF